MKRFKQIPSLAGILQPGDGTRYGMMVTEHDGAIEVIVLNEDFPDRITFLSCDGSFYRSACGDKTNPWTIKAAEEMMNRFLGKVV
jgi:hypothetical protein